MHAGGDTRRRGQVSDPPPRSLHCPLNLSSFQALAYMTLSPIDSLPFPGYFQHSITPLPPYPSPSGHPRAVLWLSKPQKSPSLRLAPAVSENSASKALLSILHLLFTLGLLTPTPTPGESWLGRSQNAHKERPLGSARGLFALSL